MDDEADLHRYGTPLEPLEKDEVPAKKPVAIEDQIVKDENGKRRFHGAFTGGFSAGFWNTVGSLEGWTPQSFKSSRGERAQQRTQLRPEDFMDNEDLGEFGIAPQGIRTREEFSKDGDDKAGSSRKRKLQQQSALGAIPGVPVLEQLLKPVRDKVAVRILRSMGWKPGQGVGPRQTRKEKKQAKARNKREQYLLQHYGMDDCSPSFERKNSANNDEDEDGDGDGDDDGDDDDDEEITFAPDDYEPIFYNVKDNRFGLSYSGLSRAPVLSKGERSAVAVASQHINLFGALEVMDKQKKLSITGQAFGVGALEEEDDDIYARDDMNRYDFSLGANAKKKQKRVQHVQERSVIEGFASDKTEVTYNEPYSIDLPRDFKPRNWAQRRSRFAPLAPEQAQQLAAANEYKKAGLGRHDLDAAQRAALLGEQPPPVVAKVDRTKELLERFNATGNNFTRGGVITAEGEERTAPPTSDSVAQHVTQENAKLVAKAANKTQHLVTTPSGGFKPFLGNDGKQTRYEQFLASELKDQAEIAKFLNDLQPVTLSAWDREMEMKEFVQARSIYKPLAGVMSDRFVTETGLISEAVKAADAPKKDKKIVVKRTTSMWKPSAQLCKRYNIAEPFGGALPDTDKPIIHKPKMSVFDYLETSINTKANFQTPVIIPKHVEQAKPLPVAAPTTPAPLVDTLEQGVGSVVAEKQDKSVQQSATKPAKYVPKTELEKRVEACKHKPISEKTELFKSIFDDSDDEAQEAADAGASTNEQKVTPEEERVAAMRAELGLPVVAKPTNAAAANVLRNNSPPRGIFAALFQDGKETAAQATAGPKDSEEVTVKKSTNLAPPKIAFKKRSERQQSEQQDTQQKSAMTTTAVGGVEEAAFYGPKLPERLETATPSEAKRARESEIDAQLQKLWMQQKTAKCAKSKKLKEDQWVEKRLASICSDSDSDSDSTEATSSDSKSSDTDTGKHAKKKKSKKTKKRKLDRKKSQKKSKKKSKKSAKSKAKTHKHKKTRQ